MNPFIYSIVRPEERRRNGAVSACLYCVLMDISCNHNITHICPRMKCAPGASGQPGMPIQPTVSARRTCVVAYLSLVSLDLSIFCALCTHHLWVVVVFYGRLHACALCAYRLRAPAICALTRARDSYAHTILVASNDLRCGISVSDLETQFCSAQQCTCNPGLFS